MCHRIRAVHRCAATHAAKGEPTDRFKYIRECKVYKKGLPCGQLESIHDTEEDDSTEDFPDCREGFPLDPRCDEIERESSPLSVVEAVSRLNRVPR